MVVVSGLAAAGGVGVDGVGLGGVLPTVAEAQAGRAGMNMAEGLGASAEYLKITKCSGLKKTIHTMLDLYLEQ